MKVVGLNKSMSLVISQSKNNRMIKHILIQINMLKSKFKFQKNLGYNENRTVYQHFAICTREIVPQKNDAIIQVMKRYYIITICKLFDQVMKVKNIIQFDNEFFYRFKTINKFLENLEWLNEKQ
ncbi:unnamed protein product [Paramecium pentaurelia]|uniref:Uncharacterized protein n=1 Tax=Paramecium pentaurelia TaxID=43138 RepID=A0A8S1SJR2_9CILI|nr:unnamed protein product [Paramecium pentaurelia]